jgi:hypothetical protein
MYLEDFFGMGGDIELIGNILNQDNLIKSFSLTVVCSVPPLSFGLLDELDLDGIVGTFLALDLHVDGLILFDFLVPH